MWNEIKIKQKTSEEQWHLCVCLSSDDEAPADGKILFKKPAKRSSSDKFQGISASSSKKKKSEEPSKEEEEKKEEKSGKKVKNRSLLSFGDDEEEDWVLLVGYGVQKNSTQGGTDGLLLFFACTLGKRTHYWNSLRLQIITARTVLKLGM